MKFDLYTDPGHGWARVPRYLLLDLGIDNQISTYSYQRGNWCYLEEDCDVTLLARALRAKGIEIEWRQHTADKSSKIRGYERFTPMRSDRGVFFPFQREVGFVSHDGFVRWNSLSCGISSITGGLLSAVQKAREARA